ncbi:MAG: DUF1028 domain-containing protein [Anaerolineales bacterium]|jgi:uncharacterized Ntn-hydrolase superfamily protein
MKPIATFSIVAYDPARQEWGVAVQSKFLAVGAVVPFARAGAGAVATQSYANYMYGPDGLDLMAQGVQAEEVIARLTTPDEDQAMRQVGVVDSSGNAASFTGSECHDWAGHIVGEGYACQGNILVPGTVEAMSGRFEEARKGDGELADWLVEALMAGQQAGGDSRGRQSAAVLVVREGGGYGGNNDHYLDLRVDDDPYPIQRLKKLLGIHHLFFGEPDPGNRIPLAAVAGELQEILVETGYYSGLVTGVFDETTRKALRSLVGVENLEERWEGHEDDIDGDVLQFLRDKFGA